MCMCVKGQTSREPLIPSIPLQLDLQREVLHRMQAAGPHVFLKPLADNRAAGLLHLG